MLVIGTKARGIASDDRKVKRAERRYGAIMYVRKCMHNVMREHMRMDVGRLGYCSRSAR